MDNVHNEPAQDIFQTKSHEGEHNYQQIQPFTFLIQENCISEFQGDAEEQRVVLHPTDDKHIIYNLTSLDNTTPENSKRDRCILEIVYEKLFLGIVQQREIFHDFEDPLENLLEPLTKLNFVFDMDYEEGSSQNFEFPFAVLIFLFGEMECKL